MTQVVPNYPAIEAIKQEFTERAKQEAITFGLNFAGNDFTIGNIKHLHKIIETLLHLQATKIEEYLDAIEKQRKKEDEYLDVIDTKLKPESET